MKLDSLTEESEALRSALRDLESQLQVASLDRDRLAREIDSQETEEQQAPPENPTTPSPPMTASAKRAAKKKAKKANKAQPTLVPSTPPPPPPAASNPSTLASHADLELENSDLRKQLTSANSLNAEYKSLLSQWEQRFEGHELEMSSAREQLTCLRSDSEANLLKLDRQQQQIADYQTRVAELENQLTIEMNNEQSVVERELNKWEEVNEKYQDALREWDVLREEYQSKEAEYLDENDALRRHLDELMSMSREEDAAKGKMIEELRLMIEKLGEDNANLSAALSRRTTELQQFQSKEAECLKEIDELRRHLDELMSMSPRGGCRKREND